MEFKTPVEDRARLWIEALRSGEFAQCSGRLCELENGEPTGYCCLGVATELCRRLEGESLIAIRDMSLLPLSGNKGYRQYDDDSSLLNSTVMAWLGFNSADGGFREFVPGALDDADDSHVDGTPSKRVYTSLTDMNDSGETFATIADVIESRPAGLFSA